MTFKPGLHTLTVLGALVFLELFWSAATADAQDAIRRAKLATVLVDRGALGSGSGFCISPKGMFLTNAHVVKGLRPGKTVRLVLSPSTADERTLDARLISVDEVNDLALVQATGANDLTSLQIGGASSLTETQPLTVVGYPFGRLLAYGGGYPSVSVGVTRVSALRKEEGELRAIQIDGAVNPGNSGGPVLNENGQVVAVVVAGIPGSGVSFSIPSTTVEKFLNRPAVLIDLPECRYVDRRKPVEFGFESIALNSSAQPNAFELTIDTGDGPGKPIKLTVADLKRKKKIKLIESGDDAAESVLLIVRRGDETAYVPTSNHAVQVGSKTFSLLELRKIDKRAEGNVVLSAEGTKFLGAISGWTDDETTKSRGLLNEADRIDVYSLDPQQREVRCTLVASKAGKEVARVEDVLKFGGAPQVLKKDVVEQFLREAGQNAGVDPLAELRAKVVESRDTPETIVEWEAHRLSGAPKWTVLEATSLTATESANASQFGFERQDDGSYFVTGPQETATYVFRSTLPFDVSKLSGIRIEIMPDSRHPEGKIGRTTTRNVVLTEVQIHTVGDALHPLVASRATCDHNQRGGGGWPATKMFDGDNATGWALGPQFGQRHEAVIELAKRSTADAPEDQIEISLASHMPLNLLGRFRISVTESPRPLIIDDLPISLRKIVNTPREERTEDQQSALLQFFVNGNIMSTVAEQELAKAIAAGGGSAAAAGLRAQLDAARDTPATIIEWGTRRAHGLPNWTVLEASSLMATNSPRASEVKFERQDDGSYFVSGPRDRVSYVCRSRLPFPLSKLTAIRLETIPDERLPRGAAGRNDNGNCVLTEFVASATDDSSDATLVATRVTADSFQLEHDGKHFFPIGMFDLNHRTGWANGRDLKNPHATVIEIMPSADLDPAASELSITIDQLYDDSHSLGRFRLSVTDAPRPVVVDKLPTAIGEIVHTVRDRRTAEQRSELLKFFDDSNLVVPKLERELTQTSTSNAFPLDAFVDRDDPYAAPLDSFEIEAHVDGVSSLWVTRHGLLWHHHSFAKPGADTPSGKMVRVNGAPWYLSWISNSGAVEGKDQTKLYRLPLGPGIWDFEVISATNGDGQPNPGRYSIDQDVMDDHTEMDLNDNEDGAGIYRVRFTRRK